MDSFIAFEAEQTKCLMKLERIEIENLEKAKNLIFERKKLHNQTLKLASMSKYKYEQDKTQEKKDKQWTFYNILDNQIKENRELKRINDEKIFMKEKILAEKYEKEQNELIEKGKKYLIDKHQDMLNELLSKKSLEV